MKNKLATSIFNYNGWLGPERYFLFIETNSKINWTRQKNQTATQFDKFPKNLFSSEDVVMCPPSLSILFLLCFHLQPTYSHI